ncbi:hypothetical protein ColTof4_14334 [Colletotrichum tofieldiae]|nr:hypothetical protein ColTof3_14745 [Colletotrichum tofieldiae]GKT81911.1 hypothetical protein ColTof4_14334 [Colletotrichum tofieldiae]
MSELAFCVQSMNKRLHCAQAFDTMHRVFGADLDDEDGFAHVDKNVHNANMSPRTPLWALADV